MDASTPAPRRRLNRAAVVAALVGGTAIVVAAALLFAPSWRASSDDDTAPRAQDEMPPRSREPALAARPPAFGVEPRVDMSPSDPPSAPRNPITGDVVPILRARVQVVDGATGRALTPADLEGAEIFGAATTGIATTTYLGLPRSGPWIAAGDAQDDVRIDTYFGYEPNRPRDAASSLLIWPLYRATEIHLRVLDAAGRAVPDARLRQWVGLGRNELVHVAASGDGVVRLAALPFLPREVVWLVVTANVADANVPEAIGAAHRDTKTLHAVARVVLPDAWVPTIDATLSLDASSAILDAELSDHNETDNDLPTAFGTLRIRARRRDGTVAAGVPIWIVGAAIRGMGPLSTDATGLVEAEVPAYGPVHVSLADMSLVPTTVEVTPREGQTVDVLLDEPEPASLEVLVSFADGRRVPFARLSIGTPSGVPAWDLEGGVLRLDPFTDENGRRVYTRVEPAEVTVNARWGSRNASTQVRLSPGHRGTARLVLPDPPDDRPAGLWVPDWVPDEVPVVSMPRER